MSTLRIVDLTESKSLDSNAMSAVRGGMTALSSLYWGRSGNQFLAVNPLQSIDQFQGIENTVGNNVANFGFFDVHNTNTQNQNAQNNVNVGGVF